MKTGIRFSQIKIIFDVSFYLTFINIKNSLFYKSSNILSSSGSQMFVSQIFTFVNICQNLSFESLLSHFPRAAPSPGPSIEWLTRFAPRKTADHFQVFFFFFFCTLPCSELNLGNHCFLCVSLWNRSTVLLNLVLRMLVIIV